MTLQITDPVAPQCVFCAEDGVKTPALFVAASSIDGGKTIAWHLICRSHATGWNDGGDWRAPVYRLSNVPTFDTPAKGLRFTMTILCESEAFGPVNDSMNREVARLLRVASESVERNIADDDLTDRDGNIVAHFEFENVT